VAAILTLVLPETSGVKLADEIADVDFGPVLSKCLRKKQSPRTLDTYGASSRLIKTDING
jgi:hypothetical protein